MACLFLWAWRQPVKSPLRDYTGAQIHNKSVTRLVNLFFRTKQSTWPSLYFDNYKYTTYVWQLHAWKNKYTSTQDSWGVRTFKLCYTPIYVLHPSWGPCNFRERQRNPQRRLPEWSVILPVPRYNSSSVTCFLFWCVVPGLVLGCIWSVLSVRAK